MRKLNDLVKILCVCEQCDAVMYSKCEFHLHLTHGDDARLEFDKYLKHNNLTYNKYHKHPSQVTFTRFDLDFSYAKKTQVIPRNKFD